MRYHVHDQSHKDPVCGMEVSAKSAVAECIYRGKAYYFCADSCRAAFEEEPETFLRHRREHGA